MLHEKLMYIQETAAEKVAKENWWTKQQSLKQLASIQYVKIHATAELLSCNAILFTLTASWSSLCSHSFEDNIQHNGTKRSPLARGREQSENARRLILPFRTAFGLRASGLTVGDTHLVENSGVESPDPTHHTACIQHSHNGLHCQQQNPSARSSQDIPGILSFCYVDSRCQRPIKQSIPSLHLRAWTTEPLHCSNPGWYLSSRLPLQVIPVR